MSSKYFSNLLVALAAGFIVVASFVFAPSVAAWVAFAFAIAVLGVTLGAQLDRGRGLEQRALDVLMGALSGTMIGVSIVYGAPTVKWLVFALALGWLANAVGGLTLHEVTTWRSSHGLAELRPFVRPKRLRSQPVGQAAGGQAATTKIA